MATTSIA